MVGQDSLLSPIGNVVTFKAPGQVAAFRRPCLIHPVISITRHEIREPEIAPATLIMITTIMTTTIMISPVMPACNQPKRVVGG